MVKLPDAVRDEITDALLEVSATLRRPQFPPLGISVGVAADVCPRRLWYGVHWVQALSTPGGRLARIFERGNLEEGRIIAELRAIGCDVIQFDAQGKQFKIRLGNEWVRGKVDGLINSGVPGAEKSRHVLEIKTANDKSWKRVFSQGIETAEPNHHAQVQLAMHFFKIKRGLYISVNKNDENIYTERVKYDRDLCETLVGRALDISRSNVPPLRPFKNKDSWQCKFCNFASVCWERALVQPSCRTCCYGEMDKPDRLYCAKGTVGSDGESRNVEEQRTGCTKWQPFKALVGARKGDDGMPF